MCQLTVPAYCASLEGAQLFACCIRITNDPRGYNAAGQSPALQVAGLTALARTQILARSVGIADDPRGYERG